MIETQTLAEETPTGDRTGDQASPNGAGATHGMLSPACSAFLAAVAALRAGIPPGGTALFGPPGVSGDLAVVAPAGDIEQAERLDATVPAGDVPPEIDPDGWSMMVDGGRRSRLVFRAEDTGRGLWLHLAVTAQIPAENNPRIAVRAFHHSSNEEAMARLRGGELVVLGELPLATPSHQPIVISLGVVDGHAIAYVDGRPRHRRAFALPAASGFVVDVHGSSEMRGGLRVIAAARQYGPRPFWVGPADEPILADDVRREALAAGGGDLWRIWRAAAGFPTAAALPVASAIAANRAAKPYLPELETLLSQEAAPEPRPSPIVRIADVGIELSTNPGAHGPFAGTRSMTVLDGVSMEAHDGDIIGVLGRNGAGKSTLLKAMVGAMPLSRGRIEIAGRAVLLRPGAGMHPNLTGRENILKSGLYMDLHPREIRAMTPEIVAFAELEDHIDRPFKYYSDGMRSRLIFAIATAMPYNILLLDELLSAGDMGFQHKVTKRLDQVIARAKALFVVQHTFDFVITRCTKCLVLERGRPVFFGEPKMAAEAYREILAR